MNNAAILFPMVALAWWTLVIFLVVLYRRLNPSLNKGVQLSEYRAGEPGNLPPYVSLPNRNITNLFEMPGLYYLTCIVLYVTGSVNSLVVGLAWAYAGIRILHSLVHVTYNNVIHRSAVFGVSAVVLVILMGEMTRALLALS